MDMLLYAIAALLASLLSPIRLVITLFFVLLTKRKWIVPVAAVISAIAVESLLTASQYTRVWGEGLVIGLMASLIHAYAIYWVRVIIVRRRTTKRITNDPGNGQ